MQTSYQVDGGGWSGWADGGGSIVVGNACAQAHSIVVRARDSAGLEGAQTASASGSSAACPPPPATVQKVIYGNATGHKGSGPTSVTCLGPNCRFIAVQVTNFPPNTPVQCTVVGVTANARNTDGSGAVYVDWGWYSGTPDQETATCSGGGVTRSG